jgi:hypothetical protein
MIAYQTQLERNPGLRARMHALEHATQKRMMRARKGPPPIVAIPVVVHVIYKKPAHNIPVAQIKSQIAVLNKDFRAANSDKNKVPPVWKGMVSDARIQFKLATKDPQGKKTSGVTRTQTTRASFPSDDSMKFKTKGGANAWDSKKYLNIWVCNLDEDLGYAQFPAAGPKTTDGVVIAVTAFGISGTAKAPFNKGRTATHEIGHFLNLRHIWGDTEDCSGSDLAGDTPNAATPNYGKPTFPSISCGNAPNGDMFMNYMDYTDDAAMFMFTPRQVARMRATLEGPRKTLV